MNKEHKISEGNEIDEKMKMIELLEEFINPDDSDDYDDSDDSDDDDFLKFDFIRMEKIRKMLTIIEGLKENIPRFNNLRETLISIFKENYENVLENAKETLKYTYSHILFHLKKKLSKNTI